MNYDAFLKSKIVTAPESGFDLPASEVSKALKPHQRDAVIWACKGGRRALFESFGLGKTVQELEWMRQVLRHCGGMGLIVLPDRGLSMDGKTTVREFIRMTEDAYGGSIIRKLRAAYGRGER